MSTSPATAAPPHPQDLHLAREIAQQPRLWREVVQRVTSQRPELDALTAPLLSRPEARVILTGAGSSAFAGEVAAVGLSRSLGRRIEAVATTDLVSNPRDHLTPDVATLLVSFARSGDSPESVAAAELADQVLGDVAHLVLTCNPEGQLARTHRGRATSVVLPMPEEAHDQSFAMTSSFTSMTLAALLALDRSVAPGVLEQRVEAMATAAQDLLDRSAEVSALADLPTSRVVYLGSGPLLGLARESALKLMELTAGDVVALADSPLGFRHGPKAVLTPDTLVVVYLANDPYTRRYDLDIVTELSADLGAERVVVVDGADQAAAGLPEPAPGTRTLRLPGTGRLPDAWWALPAVLVAQLFGLTTSLALGHTPDNPFPTGEVNRVVQGVTLHPLEA